MTNPNSFEDIFEQIADLLSLTKENEGKPLSDKKLDKNIEKKLTDLEEGVEFFRHITEEALKRSEVDEGTVQKIIENPSKELGKKERSILEKAKKLKGELEIIEREYERKSQIVKLHKKKQAKMAGKKRKKKFKRLGGEGWMPL